MAQMDKLVTDKINNLLLEAIDKGDFERATSLRKLLDDEGQKAGCGAGCSCPPPPSQMFNEIK
jgi:hypothetical protein